MGTAVQRRVASAPRPWDVDYLVMAPLSAQLARQCARLRGRVLDLGCGNRPYRPFLVNATGYVAYDLDPLGSSPEVVGRAQRLPFQAAAFDGVLCTQVLEHVPEPWAMLDEVARVLRPGGTLVLSAPLAWRLHEQPHDFFRYTSYGLVSLLARSGLEAVAIYPQGGVWAHIGQTLNNTLWRRPPRRLTPGWVALRLATVAINQGFALLDRLWPDEEDTLNYVAVALRGGSPGAP